MEETTLAQNASLAPGRLVTCICCRIRFPSVDLQKEHFKTEWHLYNLKRRICNLDPVDLDSFIVIQEAAPRKQDDKTTLLPNKKSIKYNPHGSSDRTDTEDDNDDWSDVSNEEEFLDEDYDDDEARELLDRVVKPDTCLFCDKKSSNCKNNISHMSQTHGFFIPEEKYVIDFDGLMEYLRFKVGAGATCLWCNKQFATLHGVRLHMIYKDHCKILYDQEKAVEEFKEFYDYTKQEKIEMKPLNQLVVHKKRLERRFNQRQMSKIKTGSGKQLVLKKDLNIAATALGWKKIKKFDARRAKTILKIGMTNNNALRGRLRQQNPI